MAHVSCVPVGPFVPPGSTNKCKKTINAYESKPGLAGSDGRSLPLCQMPGCVDMSLESL
jgi:hypothetical protein